MGLSVRLYIRTYISSTQHYVTLLCNCCLLVAFRVCKPNYSKQVVYCDSEKKKWQATDCTYTLEGMMKLPESVPKSALSLVPPLVNYPLRPDSLFITLGVLALAIMTLWWAWGGGKPSRELQLQGQHSDMVSLLLITSDDVFC